MLLCLVFRFWNELRDWVLFIGILFMFLSVRYVCCCGWTDLGVFLGYFRFWWGVLCWIECFGFCILFIDLFRGRCLVWFWFWDRYLLRLVCKFRKFIILFFFFFWFFLRTGFVLVWVWGLGVILFIMLMFIRVFFFRFDVFLLRGFW